MLFEDYPPCGNVSDAATAFRTTEQKIRELLRAGQLRGFKLGSQWRIPKTALLEFVKNGGTNE